MSNAQATNPITAPTTQPPPSPLNPPSSSASKISDACPFYLKTEQFLKPCVRCDKNSLICAKNTRTRGNLKKCKGCRVKRVEFRMKDKSDAKEDLLVMKRIFFSNYRTGVVCELPKTYEETEASTSGSDCPSGMSSFFFFLR